MITYYLITTINDNVVIGHHAVTIQITAIIIPQTNAFLFLMFLVKEGQSDSFLKMF